MAREIFLILRSDKSQRITAKRIDRNIFLLTEENFYPFYGVNDYYINFQSLTKIAGVIVRDKREAKYRPLKEIIKHFFEDTNLY